MLYKELDAKHIDWCYSCGEVACKSSKQRMFAWIVLQLLRKGGGSCSFERPFEKLKTFYFCCTVRDFSENSAIKPFLRKKRFWNFLIPILKEHLVNHGLDVLQFKTAVWVYEGRTESGETVVDNVKIWFTPISDDN